MTTTKIIVQQVLLHEDHKRLSNTFHPMLFFNKIGITDMKILIIKQATLRGIKALKITINTKGWFLMNTFNVSVVQTKFKIATVFEVTI